MKCYVVKDLLPYYIEGLSSEEVNAEVREHLETCTDCRGAYEQMLSNTAEEIPPEETDTDFLRKMRAGIKKRPALVVLFTCLALAGLVYFATHYYVPVPYNADYMSTEIFQAALRKHEDGTVDWVDVDVLDYDESVALIKEGGPTRDMIELKFEGPIRIDDIEICTRDIQRDGRTVKVTYFCYVKSLWKALFAPDNGAGFGSRTPGDMFDFCRAAYVPEEREIYYLQMGNMRGLEKISEEKFDALREKATLVWSGTL